MSYQLHLDLNEINIEFVFFALSLNLFINMPAFSQP